MNDKKRAAAPTEAPSLAASMAELSKAAGEATGREEALCARYEASINEHLHRLSDGMRNTLDPCERKERCSCSGPGGKPKVDLVVLLDSSGSMTDASKAITTAAKAAVEAAAKECPSDLRVNWFVVDSRKGGADPAGYLGDITAQLAGSQFTQSHQQYLESIGATGPFKQDEAQPAGDSTYPGEEGADSIADLCNFYDWREDACRSIFYISDTMLDGYSAFYDAAATNATAAALANGVVLFAHKIPGGGAAIEASYDKMTDATGGSTYHGPVDAAKYVELLKNAICKACGSECRELKLPDIKPCLSISWGNSECDCIETDDTEIAYISACNCYSNITLANLHISYLVVTNEDGSPVPTLPDGTPSVQVVPLGPICFGDIPPCREGENNCVTRQVVLRSRGAKGGRYRIQLVGICFEVCIGRLHNDCFVIDLCQD
jgi:hypothetical protein